MAGGDALFAAFPLLCCFAGVGAVADAEVGVEDACELVKGFEKTLFGFLLNFAGSSFFPCVGGGVGLGGLVDVESTGGTAGLDDDDEVPACVGG
jgi:hypothetical protein